MGNNDQERFHAACERFAAAERTRGSIGTLGEKSLHAVLKWYYEPDGDRHEVPIGGYVADIVGEQGIIEIQTRGMSRLKPKLGELLTAAHVTVVYPIIREKRLVCLSAETGEVTSSRRSPKRGTVYTAVPELYAIRELLDNPRLTVKLPVLTADETRVFGIKTRRRKKQRVRGKEYLSDLMPVALLDEFVLAEPADYGIFLPEGLPEVFGSAEFAATAHIDVGVARRTVNLLTEMGLLERVGKQGRAYFYRVQKKSEAN